jgi:hypothetical protein
MRFASIQTPKKKTVPASARSIMLAISFAAALFLPSRALAVSGFYGQLGFGYGKLGGSNLITNKQGADLPVTGDNCCPGAGPAAQFRLGYSIFGFGGAEFGIVGNGWDLSGNAGGAGFVGGGLRAFPLQFISLVSGLDVTDFPIDIGIGGLFGWSILGKDFAYTGTFFDFDLHVEYKLLDWLSAGVKVDFVFPTYSDFVYTSYKDSFGRCLDTGGNQLANGKPVSAANADVISKTGAQCNGSGPSTSLISPQIVFTFHFDPFE